MDTKMREYVFQIRSNKLYSMITDDAGLKFSGKKFSSVDAFMDAWAKKQWLNHQLEIPFSVIEFIQKEEQQSSFFIRYQKNGGKAASFVFSFHDDNDAETFCNYLEKELTFQRSTEKLTRLQAVSTLFIALAIVIGFTIFLYYEALTIAKGSIEENTGGKIMVIDYLLGYAGGKGVVAVGAVVAFFLLRNMIARFFRPPVLIKFMPT